jgi:hypothetical protein
MGIMGRSASTNRGDVVWCCDVCGRSWVGAQAHSCGGVGVGVLGFAQREPSPRPATTRDMLALADRYSLDTEQIATFLRVVREQHPGVIRTADA